MNMKIIKEQRFDEERALYGLNEALVKGCVFDGPADGESALKECQAITVDHCFFNLRYPFWHNHDLQIDHAEMSELCRAALWYCDQVKIEHSQMHGIKALRECANVSIAHCDIDSMEFGWFTKGIKMSDTDVKSEYFMMRSNDLHFTNVQFQGKYSFQYIKDAYFENCVLDTKDAFWHAENVTVKNSVVKGEYLAWYSDGLTLINCKIIGTQPFCYCKNLLLINCEMIDTDLCFERSDLQAVVTSAIDSVKNPLSGFICAPQVGEVIMDLDAAKGVVLTNKIDQDDASVQKQIDKNKAFVECFIETQLAQMQMSPYADTDYLQLQLIEPSISEKDFAAYLRETYDLFLPYGKNHTADAKGFLRINTACSFEDLEALMMQLKQALTDFLKLHEQKEKSA